MKNRMIELLDFVNGKDKFIKDREKYLNQFTPFEQRTISESVLVEGLYNVEFLNSQDRRYLGVMEGILIKEEVINPGVMFDYQVKEVKLLGISFKEKETYRQLIIRISKDFLKKRNVFIEMM